MPHAHLDAAADGELVGVDLRPEAASRAGREQAVRILDGEEPFVAENVHEISVFRRLGHHVDHRLHVLLVRVAAADGMGPEEGDADERRDGLLDAADDAQHLEFVRRVESIAALDFDGAGALAHHLADAGHRLLVEFVFGSSVQQVGGIEDPAATGGDLLVAEPVDLVQELAVAAPRIHDMRMAVAEGREDHATLGVDDGCFDRLSNRLIGHLAEPGDLAVLDGEPGVAEHAGLRHLCALLPQDARRHDPDEFADVLYKYHSNASVIPSPKGEGIYIHPSLKSFHSGFKLSTN